jgi:hypothetical protein
MTIQDVISDIDELNEDVVIYARRISGKFESTSEVVLLALSEEELEWPIKNIVEKYCPGFDYFLEGFIVKEMAQDMRTVPEYKTVDAQVKRIIYYAEFDA